MHIGLKDGLAEEDNGNPPDAKKEFTKGMQKHQEYCIESITAKETLNMVIQIAFVEKHLLKVNQAIECIILVFYRWTIDGHAEIRLANKQWDAWIRIIKPHSTLINKQKYIFALRQFKTQGYTEWVQTRCFYSVSSGWKVDTLSIHANTSWKQKN